PADIDATAKTREVVLAEPRSEREPIRWVSWQEKSRGASMPTTPGSPFLQSVFSSPPSAATAGPVRPLITDPHDVMGNAVVFSKEFVRKYFLLWYWAGYTVMRGFGFDFGVALFAALVCMIIGCLTYGYVKAREESLKAKGLGPGVAWQPSGVSAPQASSQFTSSPSGPAAISAHSPPAHTARAWIPPPTISAPPPTQGSPWTPPVNSTPTAIAPVVSDPFVGNIVLGIYHVENCDWVNHISTKNRVGFSSASEAELHGFKPCRICSPTV